mmetsp:Transcript_5453/g.22327  ORF Transcript_5453/g.22327 Transcript_5453/m.22327 type:complete len:291 (+) Transcript_5453:831-1703(+)
MLTLPAKPESPYLAATAPATRAVAQRSVLMISFLTTHSPSSSIALTTSGSSRISSSSMRPSSCVACARRSDDLPPSPLEVARKERSRPDVFAGWPGALPSGCARFCAKRSFLPMISSRDLYPIAASSSRTSCAHSWKKLTKSPGAPGNLALSSSRWDATPTGQLLVWQMRAMTHPVAIMATVPKPYSSAPMSAHWMTSKPERQPPSARRTTRWRRSFSTSVLCASTRPISMGPPACLMEERGDAPVPPSPPEIWMMSAFALATPDATVPMPAWPTSFTETLALGLTMWRS